MNERPAASRRSPTAKCLHHLFEEQVARRPHAPAIVSGARVLTYVEVDERANQLARHLGRRGVKPRNLVGLYLERSPDAIVAILAILKAGAAYVPLDPAHPLERVRRIAEAAGIAVLVSEGPVRESARALGGEIVEIDDPSAPWSDESIASLSHDAIGLTPADLSYVLYTSGSSGKPKGVMTEHGNVVSFVAAFNPVIRLTENDRVLQGFSLGFDGSVEEMWMAFSNGATLVVPPRGAARFGNDLAELVTGAKVTVLSTVPTSLSLISEALPTVRLLIVSGERCQKELVQRWATERRRMLNVYGPTETTVNATAAECVAHEDVTIGHALPGYEILLLDPEQRPVDHGAPGEIYIGGPGVARGYLNEPQLSEKHFVTLSLPGVPEAKRAYRTGDLAHFGDAGELVFLGRIDDQVKIRGYRIELSEVEAVLSEHPSIRTAAVTVVERDGRAELAAHVTTAGGEDEIDRNALLALLSSRLPSYMVPAFLDVLAAMPLLDSGKVDRKRLPGPKAPLVRARTIRPPRTPLEADLVSAFRSVLKSDAISIDDDFFVTLGGYSLLAARLVSQLRKDFALDVAIRDLYAHRTIESLAAHLKGKTTSQTRAADGSAVLRVSSRQVFQRLSPLVRAASTGLQLLGVYVLYGILALPFLAWFIAFDTWRAGTLSGAGLVAGCLAICAGIWPALLALSIVTKWVVIGRYKPGAYPLWSFAYVRFWFVRHVQLLAMPGLLAGTPLLPLYLRLLGARIGRNCMIDTVHFAIFDLLAIGDETSIGSETQLLGYHVEDGFLRIGSITLGQRCFIGTHAAVGLDVTLGDDAYLDDLSLLPSGGSIPARESRRGSPAERARVSVPDGAFAPASPLKRALFGVLHLGAIYALGFALLPTLLPGALLVGWAERGGGPSLWGVWVPLAGIASMVAFCLWIPLLKWIVLARTTPGIYRTESLLYVRKWSVDLLMHASRSLARPLYTTIYLPSWLRLLGAKIGRRTELSTVSQISPDLTELGDQSFLADGSMLGGRRAHRGALQLAQSRVGHRSFVGNSAIVPVGASLGDGCLLGCLSASPAESPHTPNGTEWLGSPAFALPPRPKVFGFDVRLTHEPPPKLIAQRLFVDALRIVLPPAIAALELDLLERLIARAHAVLSPALWLLSVPVAAMISAAAAFFCVVVTKRVLIGTFRPTVKPLWSMFVWLNEVVNGTYETVAVPLLSPLLGTPFCAPWLRLLGCKIGRHVYLETTLFSEFDLVHIGDYAALNAGVVIQNHLFEDRIMKASHVKVGEGCTVGAMAVVLYDTEMQSGSSVGPLSLLMKGETLPPQTRWLGIPTSQVASARKTDPRLEAVPQPGSVGSGMGLVAVSRIV